MTADKENDETRTVTPVDMSDDEEKVDRRQKERQPIVSAEALEKPLKNVSRSSIKMDVDRENVGFLLDFEVDYRNVLL